MISKREPHEPANDNYGRLARYIADASHGGEKCLASWTAGCTAGDDYDLAIDEVRATQGCNQRTKKEKTYHMIVSFRPEDNARLPPETLKEIEIEFARALGYENHQRHCGVHINTRNMHMHVAYNMINPETKTRLEPFRDYYKRDTVCRELEKKYGLSIDAGRDEQTAFIKYIEDRLVRLKESLGAADSWQDLHKRAAACGIAIRIRENECQFAAIGSKDKDGHSIKASTYSLDFLAGRLEERFGEFEKSTGKHRIFERFRPSNPFEDYIEERKETLREVVETAGTWQDLHKRLAVHGLAVRTRGNGCIIAAMGSRKGDNFQVTASQIDRKFSKKHLEDRLGAYERSEGTYAAEEYFVPQKFDEYVLERKEKLLDSIAGAKSWQDLHERMAAYGVELRLRGNGCTIAAIGSSTQDKHRIKASELDRAISKASLEERFGSFEKSKGKYAVQERLRFFDPNKALRENERAKKFEAHSGLKSFYTYATERKEKLQEALEASASWQDLHKLMAEHGLELRLRGNGCIVSALEAKMKGNHNITASSLGREFSKWSLEKKFGEFEKSAGGYAVKEAYKLEPKNPLKTAKDRELWWIYLRQRQEARESERQIARSWKNFAFQAQKFLDEDRGR